MAGKGGRGKISYIQQDEPDFIRKFKERVGYKEGPTVDTKHQQLELCDDEELDGEDEKPVVVVLKDGDLTAEQAERLQAEPDEPPADGKILFRKPVKRSSEETKEAGNTKSDDSDYKKARKKKSSKEVKSSLLSFDEEEEEAN